MIIAGTGHRPDKLIRKDIKPYTREQHFLIVKLCENYLQKLGTTKCISGMALGFDQAFAHAAIRLNIPLIAAVPFKGQEKIWRPESQKFWKGLIAYAEQNGEVHYLADGYSAQALMNRNRWMVDNCDQLLACYNNVGQSGTASCIRYADLKGKKVTNIWQDFISYQLS